MASPLPATLNGCSTSLNGNSSVITAQSLIDLGVVESKNLSNEVRNRQNALTVADSM